MIVLLLLIAICWGIPSLMLHAAFMHVSNSPRPLSKEEGRVLLWCAGIGYPLGLIFFLILMYLPN